MAPTTLTEVREAPGSTGGPMRNLLVFGAGVSEADRRTLEDSLALALARGGVHATPSYRVLPGRRPTREGVRATVRQGGFDGVLVSALGGGTQVPAFVSSALGLAPQTAFSDSFSGSYSGLPWGSPGNTPYGPGYVVAAPVVKLETSLWDSGAGRLVWSATTQTDNPSTRKDFVSSVAREVVSGLSRAGLLPPSEGATVTPVRAPTLFLP